MSGTRRLKIPGEFKSRIAQGLAAIRHEQDLPEGFAADVESCAEHAAPNPCMPLLDLTEIAFVTIDPAGAMDLDQALFVERRDGGFRAHYAIADVAAFVRAGDAVDKEARRRGETLYGGNSKIPLHPKVLSEGAASLLPQQLRPALVWCIDLDEHGAIVTAMVRRARVCSRLRLDYDQVQTMIDSDQHDPMWSVLREIGELRLARERERGGISLPLPVQEVTADSTGRWQLTFRARHPVEDWNAQISLLTGMAAAELMIRHRIGILRTLPPPLPQDIARLRRSAAALAIDWPQGLDYPSFIRRLDPARADHVAMMVDATTVLRGAGYVSFDGDLPESHTHGALAANYAHTTAPLRRLVDRFVGEICVALCAGEPVPAWVREALPELPMRMSESGRRASRYERAVLDLAEAQVLSTRVGEVFDASVIDVNATHPEQGQIMLRDPAVTAGITAAHALPLGQNVRVRLVEADPVRRHTRFELLGLADT